MSHQVCSDGYWETKDQMFLFLHANSLRPIESLHLLSTCRLYDANDVMPSPGRKRRGSASRNLERYATQRRTHRSVFRLPVLQLARLPPDITRGISGRKSSIISNSTMPLCSARSSTTASWIGWPSCRPGHSAIAHLHGTEDLPLGARSRLPPHHQQGPFFPNNRFIVVQQQQQQQQPDATNTVAEKMKRYSIKYASKAS